MRVALALLTMYIAWGTTYIAIAYAIETMPDLLAMGLRFFTASVLQFALVAAFSGIRQFAVTRRQLRNSLLLGAMMLSVGIGTVSTAEHVVPLGIAALIVSSMPLWTAVLRVMSGDRPGAVTVIGIVAGFVGLVIIMQPGRTTPRPGGEDLDLLLWMMVLFFGNILWSIGSFITPRVDKPSRPLVLTTYEMLSAGIVLMGIGLVNGQRFDDVFDASRASWAGWTYLVVIGSVVGYTTYNWLLTHAPISLVSTYSYVNPVVALGLAALIFGEPITSNVLVGGVLIVAAIALVASSERVKPVAATAETV